MYWAAMSRRRVSVQVLCGEKADFRRSALSSAGLSAAIACARQGFAVTLLEKGTGISPHGGEYSSTAFLRIWATFGADLSARADNLRSVSRKAVHVKLAALTSSQFSLFDAPCSHRCSCSHPCSTHLPSSSFSLGGSTASAATPPRSSTAGDSCLDSGSTLAR